MRYRLLVFIAIGVAILVGLYIVFQLYASTNTSFIVPNNTPSLVEPKDVKLTRYDSPSGFSFSYPENLIYTDTTNDDIEYASLEFKSVSRDGTLILSVVDTEAASVTEWLDDNGVGPQEEVDVVPFADIEATIVETNTGVLAVSYDEGAVFSFEVITNDDIPYWRGIIDTMLTTFEFVDPEGDVVEDVPAANGTETADIIFEGEEILQ